MTHLSTTLSRSDARRLAIVAQGLHRATPFGKGKRAVYDTISHLGYVQIDTISVTERAHNHILWSRVPGYSQKHLLDLQQKDRLVLEFWAHAAAYLPMKDYRYLIPTMEYFRNHHDPWPKADQKILEWVHERIRNEGPLRSRDFEHEKKNTSGWWDWKPAKLALQRLFFAGDIMVSHREGFQRVFDMAERILPSDIDTSTPTTEAYAQYLIMSTIRAHGIARAPEMYYLRKGMGIHVKQMLDVLCEAGEVIRVNVKGVDGNFYSTQEYLNRPLRVANTIRILSPFDNAVIQRNRLSDLFDFDFQMECYVPKPKRRYGYYCLPILRGDQFLGRVDAKADRKTGILHIIHLIMEKKMMPRGLEEELKEAFREFAEFNGCGTVLVGKTTPASWKI